MDDGPFSLETDNEDMFRLLSFDAPRWIAA
jgi:hypothetical protein